MTKQIKLFGLLTIEEDDQPAAVMKSPKGCALLVYLLVTQKAHSREALADLLWEAKTTQDSLRNLRQLLSRVKKWLPELLVDRQRIGLRPELDLTVDLYQFEVQLASQHLDQQAAALRLYDGELLNGFYLHEARHFDEWLTIERERLHRQVVAQYQQLCAGYANQEAWGKGVAAARLWVTVDELDEEAQRYLMRFLAANGQLPAALAQYQSLCQLLEAELGSEPTAETAALYKQIAATAHQLQEQVDQRTIKAHRHHWGEAPNTAAFYGRKAELNQLTQWFIHDQARLITLSGIGGQGKTTLAAMAARSTADQFDGVFWRSLINGPPLKNVMREYLIYLSRQQTLPPENLAEQLAILRDYLHNGRYLLVLDNMETILDSNQAGRFREGYNDYEQLLQLFGNEGHQSCLLMTSREAPALLTRLAQQSNNINGMQLAGLTEQASANMLAAEQIEVTAKTAEILNLKYSGNPLALKLVAQTIQDFYFDDVEEFLTDNTFIFDDIRDVLDQQFVRLSPLEQEILLWLAITREATSPQQLEKLILRPMRRRPLLEAMRGLQRRSLLEKGRRGFILQNVVTEYLTDYLVNQVSTEIVSGKLILPDKHALMLPKSKEYIRQSQGRLILEPIGTLLTEILGSMPAIAERIRLLLDDMRQDDEAKPGYAVGNLLNLLLYLELDITGFDFSHLSIRQAYLQGTTLSAINFAGADLTSSVFTDTFGTVQAVAFSPDGELLAAGMQNGEIWLWQSRDSQLQQIISDDLDTIWSIAFSPDGQTLASSGADHKIRLWDVHSGQLRRILVGHTLAVWSVAFSPDGNTLISGSDDHTVRLWDVHAGQLLSILAEDTGSSRAVAYSPDGKIVAGGSDDHAIQLWNMDSKHVRHTLHGHKNLIHALAFSPDSQTLASGAHDDTVFLWDVRTGQVRHALQGHTGWVWSVAFSPDGSMLAVASDDFTVRVWDVRDGRLRYALAHAAWIWSVAFTPNGLTLASGGSDFMVRLWDARTGQLRGVLQGHSSLTRSVAFSPDGQTLASGGEDRTAHLWDVNDKKEASFGTVRHKLKGHTSQVLVVAYSPDGSTLATGSEDHTVRLWDAKTGELRSVLKGHKDRVFGIAFSPDGQFLASGGWDHTVYLWDIHKGQIYREFQVQEGKLYHIAFSPDGCSLVAANTDHTVRLWDVSTPSAAERVPIVLRGHSASVTTVAFSPEGQIFASGSQDQTVRLWDINGVVQRILRGHSGRIWTVAFSPDGQTLASSCVDRTVRLWDVHTGQQRLILRGHSLAVYAVAFSPDGQVVASSGGDETIRLWDVQTGICLKTIRIPGPYEGMDITGIAGVSEAQKSALLALGAVDNTK